VGLAFCKAIAEHPQAQLAGLEVLGFHHQQLPPRNPVAHLEHLEQGLEPLTLRLPEHRAAGGLLQI
jgi:hypothetical protein